MKSLLEQTYWGNTVQNYFIALGIFVILTVVVFILKRMLLNRLKKWASGTDSKTDDFIIRGVERKLVPLLYIGALYAAIQPLNIAPRQDRWIHVFFSICITLFIVRMITSLLQYLFVSYLSGQERGAEKAKQIKGIMIIVSTLIWVVALLFLLNNWGYNVTTFIAGLGIGGIAIALAAQTILGDLFSYFVIFFDRPFEIGDFIVIQDKSGTVEYIGIKTTRLRSISGEQLVFSNTDLTNSRVHNYKRMERRRVVFKFGIPLGTAKDKLALIPELVRKIVTGLPDTTFDRSHLQGFGSSSFDYENVFYVLGSDYNLYMDRQQAINLQLIEAFRREGIEFAFPVQTVYLNNQTAVQQKN
ncbi:MAG TPA: mechanosensitive ion channel family protein [Chitinophaga sp.]|uniref:mechanosensitive ion channel family protein n=1 Tax=Chitinophaga sp. TaxID=1869181 RepID=UPI002CE26571|nr:mechanosensitive ion channel family protein [Chitinophaga sp.]HVI46248.1 mechanosensitive ion channel family protein [Chitinophaga sp.]